MFNKTLAVGAALFAAAVISINPARAQSVFVNGQLNATNYKLQALTWTKSTMETRLGPAYTGTASRPLVYKPASKIRVNGYPRTNPYELGSNPSTDGDYWSDAGQVGYIPDDPTKVGLDRIQTFAYYDKVYAISPRLDYTHSKPSPDPQTLDPYYATLFGGIPKQPIAMHRGYGLRQNEALVLYRDGYLGVAGTQTSRAAKDRPYPGLVFPVNKIPTAIAITQQNELALVTVWDITARKGQLAVIALEGKYIPYHTWPYMGLPNEGSWSAFKLLGYIDLPMVAPTSVSATSNGVWKGPSETDNRVLSQISLSNDKHRKNVYDGAWAKLVATAGYAIVASREENKVTIVDLTPVLQYFRTSYLSSASSFTSTLAARGSGASQFPQTFSARPSIKPTIAKTFSIPQPTAVLAGLRMERWTKDRHKAHVLSRDGNMHIIDTSPIMARFSYEKRGTLDVMGKFYVGKNPVAMCFTRFKDKNVPLITKGADGNITPDPLNNTIHVALRGDRKVVTVVSFGGQGKVYRTINDQRMADPVALSVAERGNILTVADFRGKKIISYRIGNIKDSRNGVTYGCGPKGTDGFECGGELKLPGYPFLVGTANVN